MGKLPDSSSTTPLPLRQSAEAASELVIFCLRKRRAEQGCVSTSGTTVEVAWVRLGAVPLTFDLQ